MFVGDAEVGIFVGGFVGLAVVGVAVAVDVGLSVEGILEGGIDGADEGDLVGLYVVIGFDEVGIFVFGCCDGSAVMICVGTLVGLAVLVHLSVSLNVPPTTVAF